MRCFIVIVSLCGIISVFDGGKSSRACKQYKSSNIIHKNWEKPPKNIEVKCWPLEFEIDGICLLTKNHKELNGLLSSQVKIFGLSGLFFSPFTLWINSPLLATFQKMTNVAFFVCSLRRQTGSHAVFVAFLPEFVSLSVTPFKCSKFTPHYFLLLCKFLKTISETWNSF